MTEHSQGFQRPLRVPEGVPLQIAEPSVSKASDEGSWQVPFVLARPVSDAQRLLLCVHGGRNNNGKWRKLQVRDPEQAGYVSLVTDSGLRLQPIGASEDGGTFSFVVPQGGVRAGDRLVAELGPGAVAPWFSQPNKFFLLLEASPDEPLQAPVLLGPALAGIVGACLIRITAGDVVRLRAYAPGCAVAGEEMRVVVRPEDTYGNLAPGPATRPVVRLDGREVPVRCAAAGSSPCSSLEGVVVSRPGPCRLEVEDAASGLKCSTNPIAVTAKPASLRILWGMIHGHTEISDGIGTLDDYFAYMRNECGLDFGATADHDHLWETSDEMWRLTQEAVLRHNEPGRFTTFLGYEWAKWRQNGDGDRNVYYLHDTRPIFRSDDGCFPTPSDLFRALRDERALVIPHHSANVGNHCDWKDHDPDKERLVEIYSVWGNSERSACDGNPYPIMPPAGSEPCEVPAGFVQRALELGWRVGFTAGGDDHLGHGGDELWYPQEWFSYRAGLLAVYAGENTRDAIWEALWNRRCYGTTGARILVDFSLDGHPMGSELFLDEHPGLAATRRFSIEAHGTAPITAVDVVRNNRDIRVYDGEDLDVGIEWQDSDPVPAINVPPAPFSPAPFTFYYVRVTQADGQMAWASPIWLVT